MGRMKRIVFLLLLSFCGLLQADEATPARRRVTVNNRVLASINGKVISVIDVMKKMDLMLYQSYPQYLEVPEARYDYYSRHWKEVLKDLIDRELIIADAEEKNFPVSSGDVREELEEIFGPDVMINLDNTGLTLDEAWQMVKSEILIRRMMYYQVRMRIYQQITPNEVRKSYDEEIRSRGLQKECVWQCLTVKSSDTKLALEQAEKFKALLADEKIAFDSLQQELDARKMLHPDVQIIASQLFRQKQSELAPALQELLLSMQPGSYSKPQMQTTRSEKNPVVRIYYVHEIKAEKVPTLQELEPTLREEITQRMVAEKTQGYLAELRRHFHISKEQIEKDLPDNFQPFSLK